MASLLDRITGATKRNNASNDALVMQQQALDTAKKERQAALDRMQSAITNNPYPTYLSTSPAQEYQKTLQDRMAGRGLIDVNAQTSPIAAQIRAGLQQTNANIGSAASARGLGRSTIPVSQIGQASQAAERDIAERMAQLELKRQEQLGQAVNQYGDLSRTEAQSQANRVNYNVGNENNLAKTQLDISSQNQQDINNIGQIIKQNGADAAADQMLKFQMITSGLLAAGGAASGNPQMTLQGVQGLQGAFAQQDAKRSASLVNR